MPPLAISFSKKMQFGLEKRERNGYNIIVMVCLGKGGGDR